MGTFTRRGKVKFREIPLGYWYRTCQECGEEQISKAPSLSTGISDSYRNAKCKVCKSEALDYGKYKTSEDYDWIDE